MTIRGEKSPRQLWRSNYYKKNKKRIREEQSIYRLKSYGKINTKNINYFTKSYDNRVEFLHESTTVYFD